MASATQTNLPLVINEREDGFITVQLLYFGKNASPKLGLLIESRNNPVRDIYPILDESKAMDFFNHPFAYCPQAA